MIKRTSFILGLLIITTMIYTGCSSPTGASTGGSEVLLPPINSLISSLPVQSIASIPESLESAKGTGGNAAVLSRGIYNTSEEVGVFGRIMKDLMFNWLLDLADPEKEDHMTTGKLFMAILKDLALDPNLALALDQPIDLGVRNLPASVVPITGITSADLGTMIITQPTDFQTIIHWSIVFDESPGTINGGVNYIKLNIIEDDADPSNISVYTLTGFRLRDEEDNLTDTMTSPSYDYFNSKGNIESYYYGDEGCDTFRQYTDSNGMLRTFFNADVNRSGEQYDLMFLMIGDETCAGIDSYQRVYEQGGVVKDESVSRSSEAYNEMGHMISQKYYNSEETVAYNYPLKTLTKSGYTLMQNEEGYWLENDGNDSYSVLDINLTVEGLGSVYRYSGNSEEPYQGAYSIWESGKIFVNQDVDIYTTNTELTGLNSTDKVAVIEGYLADWMTEITNEGNIDIAGKDIITIPDTEAELMTSKGLPLNYNDFPSP